MHKIRPELQKAVALFYDGSGAPQITAKGQGQEAEEMIQLARESNVPTCENAALVDLLSHIELGKTIPESLYVAIAHIIAFAYQIRALNLSEHSPTSTGPINLGGLP